MRNGGHGTVVAFGRDDDEARAQAVDQLVQCRNVVGRRVLARAQNPVRALEQVGAGAVDAVDLGACHGMAGHEVLREPQQLGGHLRDALLRGSRVGDDARIAALGDDAQVRLVDIDRSCQDDEVAFGFQQFGKAWVFFGESLVDQALFQGDPARALVGVDARQVHLGPCFAHAPCNRGPDKPHSHYDDTLEHCSS